MNESSILTRGDVPTEPAISEGCLYALHVPAVIEAGSEPISPALREPSINSSLSEENLAQLATSTSPFEVRSKTVIEPIVSRIYEKVNSFKTSVVDSYHSVGEKMKGRYKRARRIGAVALSLSLIGGAVASQDSTETVVSAPPTPATSTVLNDPIQNYDASESAGIIQDPVDTVSVSQSTELPETIVEQPEHVEPQPTVIDTDTINAAIDRYEFKQSLQMDAVSINQAVLEAEKREAERQEAIRLEQEAKQLAQEKLSADYMLVGEMLNEIYESGNPGDRIGYVKINGEQLTDRNGELVYLHQSVGFFQNDPEEGKFIDYVEEGPGMPDDYKIGKKNAGLLGHYSSGEKPAPMRNLKRVKENDVIEVVFQVKLPDGSFRDIAHLEYSATTDAFSVNPGEVDYFVNQNVETEMLTIGTCGKVEGNTGPTTDARTIVQSELKAVDIFEAG